MSESVLSSNSALVTELCRIFPGAVLTDVPLDRISRWRVGGTASIMVAPRDTEELALLRAWIYDKGLPSCVIGATSNLLFADEGLRAIGIWLGNRNLAALSISGQNLVAGPGTWVPGLARRAMLAGLTGLEHICGIPGTLGGLVCMNGGSQRKGIGERVTFVQSIDALGQVVERTQEQCGFAYRTSIFQSNDEVISQVRLSLNTSTDRRTCRREMLNILRDRRRKFPRKLPNCGSVFVSNPDMYAEYGPPGKVIEAVGLKGISSGDAYVSRVHANFIINGGNARASDIRYLIDLVKGKVAADTGYVMTVEARYVTSRGEILEM